MSQLTIKDLVDELGRLEAEGVAAKYRRMGELRAAISKSREAAAGEGFTVEGHVYTALVSARENETSIVSLAKVFTLVKKPAFLKACTMTLKNFRAAVPEHLQAGLLKTEQTGPRGVKTFRQAEPAIQKAA